VLAGIMMIHGSKLAAEDFPFRIHRRLMVWFLVSLAAHSLSAGFIVRGENLEVYDLDANCCAVIMSQGESHLDLPAGIYIVASEQSSRKVVVK
jgi:hypothetical protein